MFDRGANRLVLTVRPACIADQLKGGKSCAKAAVKIVEMLFYAANYLPRLRGLCLTGLKGTVGLVFVMTAHPKCILHSVFRARRAVQ
jgi:hypothetical protein